MKYLIDTDWAVHCLRGYRKDIVEEITKKLDEGIGISIISLAELYAGIHRSANPQESFKGLKIFLEQIQVINLDEETVKIYGREYANLKMRGKIINGFDILIASTCLRYSLILLTDNRRHFERIPGLKIQSF